MIQHRFGQDRYLPDGDWVQTTGIVPVVGVQHRKGEAHKFAEAVKKAEKQGLEYGVELEPEPDNKQDPNAIRVIGFAESKRLFRQPEFTEWHIGYIDKRLAKQLRPALVDKSVTHCAELQSVILRDEHIDVEFIVMAAPEPELPAEPKLSDAEAEASQDKASGLPEAKKADPLDPVDNAAAPAEPARPAQPRDF